MSDDKLTKAIAATKRSYARPIDFRTGQPLLRKAAAKAAAPTGKCWSPGHVGGSILKAAGSVLGKFLTKAEADRLIGALKKAAKPGWKTKAARIAAVKR